MNFNKCTRRSLFRKILYVPVIGAVSAISGRKKVPPVHWENHKVGVFKKYYSQGDMSFPMIWNRALSDTKVLQCYSTIF